MTAALIVVALVFVAAGVAGLMREQNGDDK
jgi:hypothetical protein